MIAFLCKKLLELIAFAGLPKTIASSSGRIEERMNNLELGRSFTTWHISEGSHFGSALFF